MTIQGKLTVSCNGMLWRVLCEEGHSTRHSIGFKDTVVLLSAVIVIFLDGRAG